MLADASSAEISRARRIVEDAIEKAAERTKARWDHMERNHYRLRPGSIVARDDAGDAAIAPPRYFVTDDVAAAAALIAEVEAANDGVAANDEHYPAAARTLRERAGGFWMQNIARKGSMPWGGDSSYVVRALLKRGCGLLITDRLLQVFRDVTKYGAKGDGKTVCLSACITLSLGYLVLIPGLG